jgi:predicted ATPase
MNIKKLIIISGLISREMCDFATFNFNTYWRLAFPEKAGHPIDVSYGISKFLNTTSEAVIMTHNEFVFAYLRRLIAQKSIHHNNVEIYWIKSITNPLKITINEFGIPSEWPVNMFDSTVRECEEILKCCRFHKNK